MLTIYFAYLYIVYDHACLYIYQYNHSSAVIVSYLHCCQRVFSLGWKSAWLLRWEQLAHLSNPLRNAEGRCIMTLGFLGRKYHIHNMWLPSQSQHLGFNKDRFTGNEVPCVFLSHISNSKQCMVQLESTYFFLKFYITALHEKICIL